MLQPKSYNRNAHKNSIQYYVRTSTSTDMHTLFYFHFEAEKVGITSNFLTRITALCTLTKTSLFILNVPFSNCFTENIKYIFFGLKLPEDDHTEISV